MTVRNGAAADAPIDTIRDRRPPHDPRNVWRVLAANGWTREVASEGNAQDKAAGFDRVCPARECPHRVQRWTGSEWVDVARAAPAFDLHDAVARLDTESDFGHAKSYEWIRDVALLCFNPPDEDGDEEGIIERAMVDAVDFIAAQPCTCKREIKRIYVTAAELQAGDVEHHYGCVENDEYDWTSLFIEAVEVRPDGVAVTYQQRRLWGTEIQRPFIFRDPSKRVLVQRGDIEYELDDPCRRCSVLGRLGNEPVSR